MIPGLDGLRAIAVLLVVLFHQEELYCGWIGVQLFFVLSGYLITAILVRDRDHPLGPYLKNFYGRRFFRIFPVYYAFLALLVVLVAVGVVPQVPRMDVLTAALYLYDFHHVSTSYVHSEYLTHFWSLAVEEQFYLVWPFFIWLCPPARLRAALWGIVLGGPLLRAATYYGAPHAGVPAGNELLAVYVLPWSHIDAFAIGALVVLYPLADPRRYLRIAVAACAVTTAAMLYGYPELQWKTLGFQMLLTPGYGYVWQYSLLNVTAALLIASVAKDRFGLAFLDLAPIRYLGRISYGFYIFHYPVQAIVGQYILAPAVWAPATLSLATGGRYFNVVARILIQVAITIAISSLSWHFLESPLLVFRDRWFPRATRARAPLRGPRLRGVAEAEG